MSSTALKLGQTCLAIGLLHCLQTFASEQQSHLVPGTPLEQRDVRDALGEGPACMRLPPVMGVTDVDPFILSMTQSAPGSTASGYAASAILIAAASTNVVKGIYAYTLTPRGTGRKSLLLLLALAAAGLAPLLW